MLETTRPSCCLHKLVSYLIMLDSTSGGLLREGKKQQREGEAETGTAENSQLAKPGCLEVCGLVGFRAEAL
jgi:hypothetical protein